MAPSLQSDIYSLGATLHFAIAGAGLKCASAGGSGRVPDDNRLHVIESRGGEQLRRIVSRAIAVDPGDRFDSMRELERELARLLAREFPDFTPSELADDVERLKEPPAPVPVTDSGTVLSSLTAIDTGTTEDLRVGRASGEASTQTASRPRRRHWRYWLIALTIAISGVVAFWGRMALSVDAEQEDSDVDVARAGAPDDDTAASVAATEAGEADAARQQLADAGARAAQASDTGPDRKEPRRPPRGAVRSSRAEPRAPGKLTVLARPWGRVYVDGKLIAEETPVVNVDIAPGVHRVRLFYPSLAKYSGTRRIEVRPEQTVSLSFDH